MSIADKVTSMETHISDDYEGLVNLGVDLTGINKNIQNIRTCLDTVWNNLPKVTGEGTEVILTPTLKGKLGITEKGNSTQFTTNGYQLIEDSLNGYTIGATGGVSGSSDYNLYIGKVEESQNYIISGDSIDSTIVLGFFENKPTTNSTTYNNSRTVLSNVATFTAPITRLCCN